MESQPKVCHLFASLSVLPNGIAEATSPKTRQMFTEYVKSARPSAKRTVL